MNSRFASPAVLRACAIACGLLAIACLVVAIGSTDPDLRAWSAVVGGSFLLPLAGFLPAWMLVQAKLSADRVRAVPAATANRWGDQDAPPPDPDFALRQAAGWLQSAMVAGSGTLAVLMPLWFRPDGGGGSQALIPAILAFTLLFPLIAVERLLADSSREALPEREALVRLLRVPAVILGLAGLSLLAASMGWSVAWYLQWPASALTVVIGLELVLRGVAHLWLPSSQQRSCADSLVAGALLGRLNPIPALVDGLRDRCGVDLSRSWSARLIGAALPWVMATLGLLAWLLSGISVVPLGRRMVLEDGGGIRVLGAGTHLHAPWPFATRRTVDDGRVYETALGDLKSPLPRIGAQEDPPYAYDRLWGEVHLAEVDLLVPAAAASSVSSGYGFRVVAGDVRVQWRIGSDDADAIALVGRLADADTLVARAARRALTSVFAGRPLESLLFADRDRLGADIRQTVQRELDLLADGHSGIAVAAVIIDALHPPAGAAIAYHRVQSAEIEARAMVSRGKAEASRIMASASIEACERTAAAQATAAELTCTATADGIRFDAEQRAWTTQRESMATERWLDAIRAGIGGKPVTILDHRLDLRDIPVLDLRPTNSERRP